MYEEKEYEHLIGLEGFSDNLLKNHFKLYSGYVKNTNLLLKDFETLLNENKISSPVFAELTRRLGWEFNGMRLHELYFNGLRKGGGAMKESSSLHKQMIKDFGAFDTFVKDFKAIGSMRGIGWVALYYDPIGKRLINTWIDEHDKGHLSGCHPILIMDVFEHAWMLEYGNKSEYMDSFFNAVDWNIATKRFDRSL